MTGKISIPFSEFIFETSRSGGPGGQNVNKVETRVRLLWQLHTSSALSTTQKERLAREKIVTSRMTEEGYVSIISDVHRTQKLNREEVVDRLYDLLAKALLPKRKRIATKPTKGSKMRRRKAKEQRGVVKKLRKVRVTDQDE